MADEAQLPSGPSRELELLGQAKKRYESPVRLWDWKCHSCGSVVTTTEGPKGLYCGCGEKRMPTNVGGWDWLWSSSNQGANK